MNMKKKTLVLGSVAVLTLSLLAGCGNDSKQGGANKTYKVGIVQLVEHSALDASNKGFVDGLASKGLKEGQNLKLDRQNAQADQSNLNTIAQRFVSDKNDLIGAIATPAAQSVANATKTIPVVGMAITDYTSAKLAANNEKPGRNVTGTSDGVPVEKHVALIKELLPQAKTVGVMYSSSEINSKVQVDRFKEEATKAGLTVKEATVTNVNDIQQVGQNLVNDGVDVVWIPTDNVLVSAFPTLLQIMNNAKIPVIPSDEQKGALAMNAVDYYKLGFQAGEMAAAILLEGKKPGEMAIQFQKDATLIVNVDVAKALGITVPQSVLDKVKK